jgi:pilus assembly protein CpaB
MKNIKAMAFLFLAVVIGLAAAVYASAWVAQRGNIAANKVVVAAADIELGSKVTSQMLQTVDWPSGSVPDGAFKDLKDLQDRVVKVSLLRGEPILERKLAPVGTQGGLSAVISPGKRAMTVRVNDVVGVAGFALPGNYVDVMVNAQQERAQGQTNRQISMTVLEHVLVLAVAQEAGRDETKPKVVSAVTLELAPADAEKLDLARSIGSLSLVLRNQLDGQQVATAGITKNQLFGEKEAVIEKVAAMGAPRVMGAGPALTKFTPVRHSECVEVVQNQRRTLDCF